MKRTKILLLAASLIASLVLGGCESRNQYETESNVPAATRSRTQVVKDEIPAEGQRKIPVIEEY